MNEDKTKSTMTALRGTYVIDYALHCRKKSPLIMKIRGLVTKVAHVQPNKFALPDTRESTELRTNELGRIPNSLAVHVHRRIEMSLFTIIGITKKTTAAIELMKQHCVSRVPLIS